MRAGRNGGHRSRTAGVKGSRWRQRGATLAEYLPPLLFVLMVAIPAWAKYGEVVRLQMAHAAERFADYYYRGWFWPEDDQVAGAPPSQPGSGADGGPGAGDGNGGSGGNGGESGAGSSPGNDLFPGIPGGGLDNPFAPDPGGAGGDEPLQCSVGGGGSPLMSPVGNAATYTQVGNPIDLGTGNKLQTETDYRNWRPDGLQFVRHYNSVLGAGDRGLGHGWRHSYQRAIVSEGEDAATIWRDDGNQYRFERRDGQWQSPLGIVERLATVEDERGVLRGWTYTTADDRLENYDVDGRLVRIDHPGGPVQQLHYNSEGRLTRIDDSRGDSMSLQWRAAHLHGVTLPDDTRLVYDYDDRFNLVEVVRRGAGPRGWFAGLRTPERRYHYEDIRHPHALTGMDDATGRRFATWSYDRLGRAVTSEHGDGAERITLVYRRPADPSSRERTVEVTNVAGAVALYTLEPARAGRYRLKAIDGRPLLNCAAVAQRHNYDERGFLIRRHDADGIGSEYRRDALGRVVEARDGLRFDARGQGWPEPGASRIDYRWQGRTSRLLAATRYGWVAGLDGDTAHWQPVARREWQRDPRARLVSETITDLTAAAGDSAIRTTRYRYIDGDEEAVPGLQALEVTDSLGHVTRYQYDAEERLQVIVNTLGQRTQFSDHTREGRPRRVALPDGQQLRIAYDALGLPTRLERRPADTPSSSDDPQPPTEITRIDYDAEGRTTTIKRPDGSSHHYHYNAAGQLIEVRNGWDERIALRPNVLHGHWQEQWRYDADGDPVLRQQRHFNALGQLATVSHGDSAETHYLYDARGNLIEWREAHENPARTELAKTARVRYDTQHHPLEWIDAAGHATRHEYDAGGRVAAITDANGNTTRYRRNGFGEIVHQRSPATGDEWRRYDGNGNLIAKGATAAAIESSEVEWRDGIRFRYDALNRPIHVDYMDDADDITYTYDQVDTEHGNGIGRLTRLETAQQIIDYRYDGLGRKIAETIRDKVPAGYDLHQVQSVTVGYGYLSGSRLERIVHPDGSATHYRYDNERIRSIVWREPGTNTKHTIIEAIDYAPFGDPIAWTYGNGLTQTRRFDLSGRITDITLRSKQGFLWPGRDATDPPVWSQKYDYSLYRSIGHLTVDGEPRQFGYDAVDRLGFYPVSTDGLKRAENF